MMVSLRGISDSIILAFLFGMLNGAERCEAGVFFPVSSITAGEAHTCALIVEEGVRCWGRDTGQGQMNVPQDLTNPTQLAAGARHTCALTDKGVRCWGRNVETTAIRTDLKNPVQLAAGHESNWALTDEGVKYWGPYWVRNQMNAPPDLVHPTQLVAAGHHACALTDEGVRCWGSDWEGDTSVPTDLINPTQIATGVGYTCALTDDGVRCWGYSYNYHRYPVPSDLVNVTQLVGGVYHTCAITDEGVKCWGINGSGGGTTVVPADLNVIKPMRSAVLTLIARRTYIEKKNFLENISRLVKPDFTRLEQCFFYFALKPFLQSLNSDWAIQTVHSDLPRATAYFESTINKTSLADFELSSEFLRATFQLISEALIAPRNMLTVESQRELEDVFLPELATKLAKSELTPGDGEDIAQLFASHRVTLGEMAAMPRLKPFEVMIEELIIWLNGK